MWVDPRVMWLSCMDQCQTEFQFCQVPGMGGIKLQLLCGVRIELAVGSLPYQGNYLEIQFVSPGRDRPLSGFPICKPCLAVRQNPSRDTHFSSYGRRSLPKTQKQYYLFLNFHGKRGICAPASLCLYFQHAECPT